MSLASVEAIDHRQGPAPVSDLRIAFDCSADDCVRSQEFTPNQINFRGEGYNGQPYVDLAAAFGMMDGSGWTVADLDGRISMRCPDHPA